MRTPCFIIDEKNLLRNLEILKRVKDNTGCKILLAQKAYSCYATYPLIAKYLDGTTASGLYEAKLGKEHFPGEVHVFSPAYKREDFEQLLDIADEFVFNSMAQLKKYAPAAKARGKGVGLRLNPECSTQDHAIYDPCSPGSRMGVRLCDFDESALELADGFHMHTLCEQNSDALAKTVGALVEKFGKYLHRVKWLNLGGGHHITRHDYDIPLLEKTVRRLQDTYGVQVYLEPGEAVVLNAGELNGTVLDIVSNGIDIAVLDTSAACHMPDVLEMPYRPPVLDSGQPGEKKYTYRLAGNTCLAGDVIGDYSFDMPLRIGDRVTFLDMALYTMVKTNTFNGTPLPDILYRKSNGELVTVRTFSYDDFKSRL